MSEAFIGAGEPLGTSGFQEALDILRTGAPELWAVLRIESNSFGFLRDRRPKILFERHVFHRLTKKRHDATHPELSDAKAGGYAGGAREYERLEAAIALDGVAALESASWGLGQVMGFNAGAAGHRGVREMIATFKETETAQLRGMAHFIEEKRLAGALRARDWPAFARGYNGAGFKKQSYDTRLASAYAALLHGGLPDLTVRAAQAYLTYLGYRPGAIDGVVGRFTLAALHAFQEKAGLDVSDVVNDKTLEKLKRTVDEGVDLSEAPAT